MITKITTIEELKQVFAETLFNNTDKVTKISDGSSLNGISYGISKLMQKAIKDMAIVESHILIDSSFGEYLDEIALREGMAARFGATQSSTYIRVFGTPGTTYNPTTHVFTGKGVEFVPENIYTIPAIGFGYIKVQSIADGALTNVDPLTINKVTPIPSGHNYCINEFEATGGRDVESDDDFKRRLKEGVNVLAKTTLSFLEQVFRKINSDILKVYNLGLDAVGELQVGVSKVNGATLTQGELDELMKKGQDYFSMNELKPDGEKGYGIKLVNIPYFPIDVSARVDIDASFNNDLVRKKIQISLNKVIDYRTWKDGGVINWIDLINAIKQVDGVKRVLDNYFSPNNDIIVPKGVLPRFRGFLLLDLRGEIIANEQNTLNPVYYPAKKDFNFQASVLKSI